MTPFGRFLEQYFPIFIEIGIGLCVLCLGASIVYRLLKGKGFRMKVRGQIRFHEWFGSGHSHRGWFTRIIGRAQNCLAVTATDTELLIRPWFPFFGIMRVWQWMHCTLFLPVSYRQVRATLA